MKRLGLFLSIFSLAFSLSATTPPISFSVDTETPTSFDITTYVGNTPTITVNIMANGSNFTGMGAGWSCQLNYAKNNYASYIKTITGTVVSATGIATFNAATNTFPSSGDWLGEVFLQNGSTKITTGQGVLHVLKSPSSGSVGSLNLQNVINWDIVSSIGQTPWSDFDTNTLQSQISANLASANATSVVFQAKFDALANTNALKVDITTFNATNALKVDITTFNATNDLKVDLATFNATNALKVDVTTFNATNALKVDLTDYAIVTNLFATGKVDLVTFNATNALKVDITTFNATNALKVDVTTFNATNALKTDVTTFNASNAVLQTAADYGITAYGWSNHANFGYLTSATNIFTALYVANRSQLDTNIAGLTQGVYTGSLTTVAYTGATALVIGKTYVYGYSKVGASGTSTLSIAGFTLGPHTAVGNYSNHFSFEDTGTNLVIKLDGAALAQCNASNLYVKAVTGGDINAAGDVNVGGVLRAYGAILTNPAAHIADTSNPHAVTAAQAGAVGTNDAAYTNAVALSGSALQSGADGTWTNLSEYNDDLAGSSSNLSDYNNDVPFVTGTVVRAESDPIFIASVAYAISAGDTTLWHQASADGISATADVAAIQASTGLWNTAATDAFAATNFIGTNTIQAQIDALGTQKLDKTEAATTYAATGTVGVIDTRVGMLEGQTNSYLTNEPALIAFSNANQAKITAAITNEPHSIAFSNLTYSSILQSMTNFTAVGSSSNYLTYDPATRLLSGCVTNAGAGGAGSGFPLEADGDLAGYSLTNGAFVGDGAGLTNVPGTETNVLRIAASTNIVFFEEGGTNFIASIQSVFDDTDFNAATGALNTAVSDLQAATGSLDTAVGNLNAATGSLDSAVSDLQGATNANLTLIQANSDATNALNTRADSLEAATNAINTVANAALPKAGGTMSGDLDMGGQAVTNADYVATTNYVWLPVNGTVYFGTTTNYIQDQNGTNFLFKAGTQSANFGW